MLQAININKLVLAVATIAVVATAGFLSTRAFFSDTETSQANAFTAGSLTMQVAQTNSTPENSHGDSTFNQWSDNRTLFTYGGLIPGDSSTADWALEPTQESWACLKPDVTSNTNGMKNYVEIAYWNDTNNNGLYNPGAGENINSFDLTDSDWLPVEDSSGAVGDDGVMTDGSYRVGYAYCFGSFERDGSGDLVIQNNKPVCDGSDVTNSQQNGQVEGSMYFYAEQKLNNDNFVCSSLNPVNAPQTHTIGGSVPAGIIVEDLGGSLLWTIDIDEVNADDGNGHYAYGLVISQDGMVPEYQIHSNDGTDSPPAFGTHLYSAWGPTTGTGYNGWHTSTTNVLVSALSWVTASGDRDATSNPDGVFTIEIDKSELNSTFYWGVMTAADATSSYPSTWTPWSGNASGLEQYDL
ncbi:MAG: hypothetical protein WD605_01935 [Candidatus Paceibacterota bacterium]